jgi:glutamate-1-semialdehyde 2,1-aminomutase
LAPAGVPRELRGTSHPFPYNDLNALRSLLDRDPEIGVIYMEVQRSVPPAPGFLEGVRELATRHNAVLIFDECTSGFRRSFGGLHLHYGVDPDIATFGKTLGNGYAITAVIGRAEVMEAAQSTFISSTFWTERIGPTAALATLDVMAREDAPARVNSIGSEVQVRWTSDATDVGLDIDTGGLPALANFTITGRDPLLMKTYITARMLALGYLAGPNLYASIAHTPAIRADYHDALASVFADIAVRSDDEIRAALPSGLAHSGFRRLT